MKGTVRFFLGIVLACAGTSLSAQQLGLDEGLAQIGKGVEGKLPAGSNLAVLNFSSESEAFSNYVIEELTGVLVMSGKLSVIERRSLDLIRQEMNLHLSGDVSDDSALAIGKQLGAQGIVTGSLTNMGSFYRFRIKVINVETARIEAQLSFNLRNDEQVAFLLHGSQRTAPPVAAKPVPAGAGNSSAGSTPPAPAAGKVYKIGDTGPAGGLIFYDKGNNTDGWRYLEVASKDAGKGQWGVSERSVITGTSYKEGTDTKVGAGKRNTEIIIYSLRLYDETGRAAQLAQQYTQGGYTDWFLPSKDELDLIHKNLRMKFIGEFTLDDYYWSSSENATNSRGAWCQRFRDGIQENSNGYWGDHKERMYAVRAVRAF